MIENLDFTLDSEVATILVVDDIAANRSVICRRMEMLGYAVVAVDTGREAIDLISHTRPDLVLLDYMMPNMNGLEVLRELRGSSAFVDLPVIMVTARAESQVVVDAIAAGANELMTKPIDYDVLKVRIDKHLARSKPARSTSARSAQAKPAYALGPAPFTAPPPATAPVTAPTPVSAPSVPNRGKPKPDAPSEQAEALQRIRANYEKVFEAVLSGGTPNIAQMSEIREALDRLVLARGD